MATVEAQQRFATTAAVLSLVLVGAGDAMTFISALRLVSVWFPPASVPLLSQLTGILGQVSQSAAAYPLVTLRQRDGWSTSFLVAARRGVRGGAARAARGLDLDPFPRAVARRWRGRTARPRGPLSRSS